MFDDLLPTNHNQVKIERNSNLFLRTIGGRSIQTID